ncbi:hypothetical protein ERO13_D11G258475v2, partial [Gossypium hirsutum]
FQQSERLGPIFWQNDKKQKTKRRDKREEGIFGENQGENSWLPLQNRGREGKRDHCSPLMNQYNAFQVKDVYEIVWFINLLELFVLCFSFWGCIHHINFCVCLPDCK